MELVQSLSNRLQELFLDGKWVTNTNYKDLLESTNFSEATKVIYGRNSIALLTFHINYYLKGLNEAFSTSELNIRDKFSYDMPSLKDEVEWKTLKNGFFNKCEYFHCKCKSNE